jgi:hypothetical protein
MSKKTLELILSDKDHLLSPQNKHVLPSLNAYLSRARYQSSSRGHMGLLCDAVSINPMAEETDLPAARLRGGDALSICFDPCYLHADRGNLLLFYRDMPITDDEAQQLVALISPLVETYGASISIHQPNEWLLHLAAPTEVAFSAIEGLHGQTVTHALPTGTDASQWIQLWNEIQMVLFECPVNQQRERRGEPPINGIWFWGASELPDLKQNIQLSGALSSTLREQIPVQHHLAIQFSDIGTLPAIHFLDITSLDEFMSDWLQPAIKALQKWQLDEFIIHLPFEGSYFFTPLRAWQIWR